MYKQAILQDPKNDLEPAHESEFIPWSEMKDRLETYLCKPAKVNRCDDGAYEVMCENDHKLVAAANEAKEYYEFKGLLNYHTLDIKGLLDIYHKHMHLEEWDDNIDDHNETMEHCLEEDFS